MIYLCGNLNTESEMDTKNNKSSISHNGKDTSNDSLIRENKELHKLQLVFKHNPGEKFVLENILNLNMSIRVLLYFPVIQKKNY